MSSQEESILRVVGLFANNVNHMGGCEIYRITQPLYRLDQTKGFQTAWMKLDDLGSAPEADIYVMQRMSSTDADLLAIKSDPRFEFMVQRGLMSSDTVTPAQDLIRLMGKKLVYEVDDDFTNKYRNIENGGQRMMDTARACDAITVSTKHLGKVMQEETGKPVYVCKNYVNMAAWKDGEVQRKLNGITIGITGSTTHLEDWRAVGPALHQIVEKYPNINLLIGGFYPPYLPEVSDRVQYIEYLPYKMYMATMRSMDIVLCPVDPKDQFNLSKSPIKAIEANAAHRYIDGHSAGAAVIATNNPVYREWVIDAVTGLLVEHTTEAWFNAIELLILDATLRKSLSIRGYKHAQKHGDINTGWKDWARAYRAIARGESQ